MNELLFFGTIVLIFSGLVLVHRYLGKIGVCAWAVMATIIANIEVAKCIDMFGLSVTLGNVIYGSVFLCTDMLSELYGEKEAKKCINLTLVFMVISTILFQVSLLFVPNEVDTLSPALKQVFSMVPRFTITSIICFIISNRLDIYLYQLIKRKFPEHLWLRNNGATMIAQFMDSVLYCLLAFTGLFDVKTLVEVALTTYLIKLIIAACDTPFLYLVRYINNKKPAVCEE